MYLEKTMDILEFRKYLLSNLDKYSISELELELNKAKNNFENVKCQYEENKETYES